MMRNSDMSKAALLHEISKVDFAVVEMTLYLDTHPTDSNALQTFTDAAKQRKQLMEEYARQYEPLTMDCVCVETNNQTDRYTKYPKQRHFTWCDGPLPWEGGIL